MENMHTDVRIQKGEECTVDFFPVFKCFFFFFSFFNIQLGVLFLHMVQLINSFFACVK